MFFRGYCSGFTEFPDEEGTEIVQEGEGITILLQASLNSPMRRGLKFKKMVCALDSLTIKSFTEFPDEEGTDIQQRLDYAYY